MTGEELRELRVKLGYKQAESARMAKVALRTWQAWESGTCRISASGLELWLINTGRHTQYQRITPSLPTGVVVSDTQSLPVDTQSLPVGDLEALMVAAMRGEITQSLPVEA